MKRVLWIPLSVLGGAAVVVALLMLTRPEATPIAPEPRIPVVQVLRVEPGPLDLVVRAQGTVTPRTESEIRSQLAGEIEWVSPDLVSGGFFAAGDPLLRIDPADTRAKLETARAVLARAESELERAVRDRARQRRLAERSVASPARLDEVENVARGAKASVREATARLEIAERDLDRTTVRAPYAGRVRNERVDRGQFVVRGEELARVYAVDYAEVRLPIPDRELRYLDLPLGYREPRRSEAIDGLAPSEGGAAAAPAPAPRVDFEVNFAGAVHHWQGSVVRTEGELDPKSRMVTVVARVEDPYGRHSGEADRPPLAVGLFVKAKIAGRHLDAAVVLPRSAIQREGKVLVVDDDGRAHFREVEVIRQERESVIIGAGLHAGERVCVSPMPGAVDGMRVRVLGSDAGADAP